MASSAVDDTAAGPPRSPPAGHHLAQELATGPPRSPPAGPRFAQEFSARPPRRLPACPWIAQDLTVEMLRNAFIGHLSILDPIAESPSSSDKAAVTAGASAGVAFRPPFVSRSPTLGVSLSATPRPSSGLVSSRTRRRSAAAAGTPLTPTDYGLGRRTSATPAPRPSPTHRRPPAAVPRPLPRRPDAARRSATQDSPSPATPASATLPVFLPPPQSSVRGPSPPPSST